MKEINFYVATGFDQFGQPISPKVAVAALTEMRGLLCDKFGGYTETAGQGGWQEGKMKIIEPCIVFTCVAEALFSSSYEETKAISSVVNTIGRTFAKKFDQKCVMVTIKDINCLFIEQ